MSKKAYMIVIATIHDRESFVTSYGPAAAKLTEKFGGKYLIRAPGGIPLEGMDSSNPSVVISEWPDKETAEKFWYSEEYSEVKKFREGIADCKVLLVESG